MSKELHRFDRKQKMKYRSWIWVLCLLLIVLLATALWGWRSQGSTPTIPETLSPYMTYEVVNVYPHDPAAFTQGLIFHDGYLYESTGLYGESSLRKVELGTGTVLQQVALPPQYFGEGLTDWEDMLVQLTWQENTGFVYDREDFTLVDQFSYPTEGWGLTHDGHQLIMSDGTASLYFLDPGTWEVTGNLTVTYQGKNISRLNELEYIHGEVYANVWLTDDIVRIDPGSGEVLGWIDLSGILPEDLRTPTTDVLNGIAYDIEGDRLFITGKNWPMLYEIRLVRVLPPD
jgi:glutaminyl-peptide cyclotransferase